MARNPYQVLGVPVSASDSEIRAAFRKLAKQLHPDRNPGDKPAEEKFKEVSGAFDILGDTGKRKRFDRGEIDEQGRERAPFRQWSGRPGAGAPPPGADGYGYYSKTYGNAGPGAGAGGQGASFDDLGDIFADLFGSGRRGAGAGSGAGPGAGPGAASGQGPGRGRDARYRLEVDFLDAVNGAAKRVTMPDGREFNITVPAGFEDGQSLRLKGQGDKGPGGAAGDVYVEIKVKPHEFFTRDGADIHTDAPISLQEAVLGGKITAQTISGDVSVTVPKWSNSGAVLRLKGRGAPTASGGRGDQYVTLKIVLPEGGDAELEEFVRRWKAGEKKAAKKDKAEA